MTVQALFGEAAENLRIGKPKEVLRLARALARRISDPYRRGMIVGGFLIDAGADLRRAAVVRRGVTMLLEAAPQVGEDTRAAFNYNLGNGWLALARFERGVGPGTHPSLDRAVSCFDEALSLHYSSDAATNLANALRMQGRVVEAVDEYERLLERNPGHHQALANRGLALEVIHRWTAGHAALLTAALRDYDAAASLAIEEPVFRRMYDRAAQRLRERAPQIPEQKLAGTPYEEWIWASRLALNPCPICRWDTPSAFDTYPLAGALAGGSRRPPLSVPFDLVNSLCRSFAAARWQLFKAVAAPPAEPDSTILAGGSPNAIQGLKVGLLMASIGGFYEVMNQVSFGVNSYFGLGHDWGHVYLDNVWNRSHSARNLPKRRSEMHPRLVRPASAELGALFNLARSFEFAAGRYSGLRKLRNNIAHHIVVPADQVGVSPYFVIAHLDLLRESAYDLGRLAKAAIWYFGAAIHRAERTRARRASRRGQLIHSSSSFPVQRA